MKSNNCHHFLCISQWPGPPQGKLVTDSRLFAKLHLHLFSDLQKVSGPLVIYSARGHFDLKKKSRWNVSIDKNVFRLCVCSSVSSDNILVLDIYFEALNYETIEQKKAYELAGLLGKKTAIKRFVGNRWKQYATWRTLFIPSDSSTSACIFIIRVQVAEDTKCLFNLA